jgi:hypothetical protein
MKSIHPNWFVETGAKKIFEENLSDYAGKKINFLQIGAFTGDASVWLLENILTNSESTLTDVDSWAGYSGLEGFTWETAHDEYKNKLSSYSNKVSSIQMTSDQFFKQNKNMYDIIYIDGDHSGGSVLRDAVNAFDCLTDNGLLIFDDYIFASGHQSIMCCPKYAIDSFINIHWFDLTKIYEGTQMWLKKVKVGSSCS